MPTHNHDVQAALAGGVPVWSEVELATRFLSNRIVGITGTNGKTTTTELIGAACAMQACQWSWQATWAMRWRTCPTKTRADDDRGSRALELSARAHRAFRVEVAVLLNLTEDHLDRHGTLADYATAKLRIFREPGCRLLWR